MLKIINYRRQAFTIVELLIVIVVIGILAAIVIISYNGISNSAQIAAATSNVKAVAQKAEVYRAQNSDVYPPDKTAIGVTDPNISYTQTGGGVGFCASATVGSATYHASNTQTTPSSGSCPLSVPVDGSFIQTITSANCPSVRTRAVDARDSHTYWVQKLADGKCWMLTNLAYAGGGTNTYSDTKSLTNGTSSGSETYTTASYYIPTGANVTTNPTAPSTATTGTGQYGYLYNWCGAMGGQATAACANATTPAPNASVSVCPAGWRLPTGNGGELGALNTAINSGSSSTDAGFRSAWLSQYSGVWGGSFFDQGDYGYYWSSSQFSTTSAYYWLLDSGGSSSSYNSKVYGFAVRCVAS